MIHKHLEEAMTVGMLIEELKNFDPDQPVMFAYNYGDYWRTQVAANVRTIDEVDVVWSEYHRMAKVIESDDDEADGCALAVVINI